MREMKRITKSPTVSGLWITDDGSKKLRGPICWEDGNMILMDLETELPVRAIYGTINEEGEFLEFCSITNCCGCKGKNRTGACRENKAYQKVEGEYIEI